MQAAHLGHSQLTDFYFAQLLSHVTADMARQCSGAKDRANLIIWRDLLKPTGKLFITGVRKRGGMTMIGLSKELPCEAAFKLLGILWGRRNIELREERLPQIWRTIMKWFARIERRPERKPDEGQRVL